MSVRGGQLGAAMGLSGPWIWEDTIAKDSRGEKRRGEGGDTGSLVFSGEGGDLTRLGG